MSNDHSSQRIKDNIIIQEAIKLVEDGICVTFPVDGRSMLPFIIGGKESVILEKPSKPGKGDIVLAWVDNCRYVVHRIIDIQGDDITGCKRKQTSGRQQELQMGFSSLELFAASEEIPTVHL